MSKKKNPNPQASAGEAEAAAVSADTDRRAFEQSQLEELGALNLTKGAHTIHCLTVIGQVEGHVEAPQGQKTTKYEHVIPQLVAVQEDPAIEGLLVLLNTVGGDVEAGLALAELIASISKPSATLVLGGGHSIGIPLAVSARRSFIVPTATMTVHPVRHSGMILGVPQTMRWFEQMQERITGFVAGHSRMSADRFNQLMLHTGELVMDMGTVLDGRRDSRALRPAGRLVRGHALAVPADRKLTRPLLCKEFPTRGCGRKGVFLERVVFGTLLPLLRAGAFLRPEQTGTADKNEISSKNIDKGLTFSSKCCILVIRQCGHSWHPTFQ